MAARKRKMMESYKRYRANLKAEEKKLRRQLMGRVIWPGQWGTAYKRTIYGKPYYANDQHTVPLT